LGNPGSAFEDTRHNIGFKTIDKLAEQLDVRLKKPVFKRYFIGKGIHKGEVIFLIKPLTYMNCSGEIIKDVLKRANASNEDLLVILDTLDLPTGVCRLKPKGGAAGHRGLGSIIKQVGTDEVSRLFIGVGRPECKEMVIDYVLNVPSKKEFMLLDGAINLARESVLRLLHEPIDQVMNDLNKKRDG
jgi:PTH1 family peptidyl-tRNA hydrolase